MARKIKYPKNSRPDNDLGVGDRAIGATGKSGRTTPNVTLTPGNSFTGKGETVDVGGAKERKIRKPNRPLGR